MRFQPGHIYHIYNRGNNSQRIFFNDDNYRFFIKKVKKELLPACNILAYCLLPNHFHFMASVKDIILTTSAPEVNLKYNNTARPLNDAIRILLSSYTRAINNQEGRCVSLFQQNTKAKLLNHSQRTWKQYYRNSDNYPFICFNYIYQNPVNAGLVRKMEHWKFSSFNEYLETADDSICNIKKGI